MKASLLLGTFAVILSTLPSHGLLAQDGQGAELAGIDAYTKQAMQDWKVPGVAIAVVKDDKIVFARGFGVRENGKPEPTQSQSNLTYSRRTKPWPTMTDSLPRIAASSI